MTKVNIKSEKIIPFGGIYYASKAFYGSVENAGGTKTKNIKKHPFTDASASHLSSARWHRQKDKNRSPSAKHTTLLPPQKHASHGRDVILREH